MAITRTGPLVQAISGNVAGVNFVAASRGNVVRKKRNPATRATSQQLNVRAATAQLAHAWTELTDAQRAAWRTAGRNVTRTDRLGTPRAYTGREWFFRAEMFLAMSRPLIFNPNTIPTRINQPPTSLTLTNTSTFTWTLTWTYPDAPFTQFLYYEAARTLRARPQRVVRGWAGRVQGPFEPTATLNVGGYIVNTLGGCQLGEYIAVRAYLLGGGGAASDPVTVQTPCAFPFP